MLIEERSKNKKVENVSSDRVVLGLVISVEDMISAMKSVTQMDLM